MTQHLTLLRGWLFHLLPQGADVAHKAREAWVLACQDYEPSEGALAAAQDALWARGVFLMRPEIRAAVMAAIEHDGRMS